MKGNLLRRIPLWFLCFFMISAVAEPLLAQGKCSGKGTFARRTKDGQIEYCWHGTYYTEASAPGNVRAFFAEAVARSNAAARKRRARSERTASQAQTPQSTAVNSSRPSTVGSVTASTKPVAAPVDADLIASIETGTDGDEVIAKLGRPHGSIGNLGDEGTEEAWSYRLPDGGIAKVRLDRGKVTAVQLPQ